MIWFAIDVPQANRRGWFCPSWFYQDAAIAELMMEKISMPNMPLDDIYQDYIDCLNRQEWVQLGKFVDNEVKHNGRPLHLSGYREMLLKDFEDIPDLRFNIQFLITEPPRVAARLAFECSPKADFLGLSVNGRKISFGENVFYEFKSSKIVSVWSVIDKTSIEAQLLR